MPALCEPRVGPAPGQPDPGPRLVIQLARLGDFLQTTPLLAALKQSAPRLPLAVLVSPAQAPLARACRWVDEVLSLEPSLVEDAAGAAGEGRRLRLARLQGLLEPLWAYPAGEVLNLNLSRLAALVAQGWSEARLRGWRLQGQSLVGEAWTPFLMRLVSDRRLTRLHLVDILASYGHPPRRPLDRLEHRVGPEAAARAAELLSPHTRPVVLQLGANNDLRRWPVSHFARLARGLLEAGHAVVLVGSGRERVLARRLGRELGGGAGAVLNLMGRTDLATLGGVLAAAALVVSADTGTLHLATAVGSPVLALYMGPAQAHETGPYGPGHLVLQARDQCGPCQEHNPVCRGRAPCRRLITPELVLAAARSLLQGDPATRAVAGREIPSGVDPLEGMQDAFGQRYRHLRPRPLDTATGLALALRRAGRVLLRPGGEVPGMDSLAAELAREHRPAPAEHARQLAGLARAARSLAGAAAAADAGAARRILARAPGLSPLGVLVGPGAPPGLVLACSRAAEVLAAASDL